MNEREMLLKQIQSLHFSVWELHIFLDTHPTDAEALQKLKEYEAKSELLVKRFEDKFGPLSKKFEKRNSWEWISSPWPWENPCDDQEVMMNVDV